MICSLYYEPYFLDQVTFKVIMAANYVTISYAILSNTFAANPIFLQLKVSEDQYVKQENIRSS